MSDNRQVWHMARCRQCGGPAQPFQSHHEREAWVTAHRDATGHAIGMWLEAM